jgi:phosphoribosylglycinamide formyltransferase-1
MTCRIVVLASGTGSLFSALLDARNDDVVVEALITDVPTAGALAIARNAGVETRIVDPANFVDREEWDQALTASIQEFKPTLVVSAGFMRILGHDTLRAFPNRIINTHPALLPAFPGAHAVRDALAAGVAETGCTVHVVDEGVDTGPVIAQETVAVLPDDNEAVLHERIKSVERRLLVDVVRQVALGKVILP